MRAQYGYGRSTEFSREMAARKMSGNFCTPSKRRKTSSPGTSPTNVAGQIQRKYCRMQVQHLPLSTTALSLLLRKLNDSIERGSTVEPPQLQLLHQHFREDYSQLVVEDYKQERYIVISR